MSTRFSKLLLATGNAGKVRELSRLLADLEIEVLGLKEVAPSLEVVEDRDSFLGNATKKAREWARATGLATLADDSGLEVDALGGAPGIHSARYAGPDATDAENNAKLLAALADVPDAERTARFRCALLLVDAEGEVLHHTDGRCEGRILRAPRGEGGFGYDPLFLPEGESRAMAELAPEEKNAISHRAHASAAMKAWLVAPE